MSCYYVLFGEIFIHASVSGVNLNANIWV